jgi:hypothetical protein
MHPLSETVDVLSDTIVVDAGAVVFEVVVEFTLTVVWFTALVAEPLGAWFPDIVVVGDSSRTSRARTGRILSRPTCGIDAAKTDGLEIMQTTKARRGSNLILTARVSL